MIATITIVRISGGISNEDAVEQVRAARNRALVQLVKENHPELVEARAMGLAQRTLIATHYDYVAVRELAAVLVASEQYPELWNTPSLDPQINTELPLG